VIGDEEMNNQAVSVRLRTDEDLGRMSLEAFISHLTQIVASKSLMLTLPSAE